MKINIIMIIFIKIGLSLCKLNLKKSKDPNRCKNK